jgi:hypothetical protein
VSLLWGLARCAPVLVRQALRLARLAAMDWPHWLLGGEQNSWLPSRTDTNWLSVFAFKSSQAGLGLLEYNQYPPNAFGCLIVSLQINMVKYADPDGFIARLRAEPNHRARYVMMSLKQLRPTARNYIYFLPCPFTNQAFDVSSICITA